MTQETFQAHAENVVGFTERVEGVLELLEAQATINAESLEEMMQNPDLIDILTHLHTSSTALTGKKISPRFAKRLNLASRGASGHPAPLTLNAPKEAKNFEIFITMKTEKNGEGPPTLVPAIYFTKPTGKSASRRRTFPPTKAAAGKGGPRPIKVNSSAEIFIISDGKAAKVTKDEGEAIILEDYLKDNPLMTILLNDPDAINSTCLSSITSQLKTLDEQVAQLEDLQPASE